MLFSRICFCLVFAISISVAIVAIDADRCEAQSGTWNASLASPGGPIRFQLQLKDAGQGCIVNGSEKIEIATIETSDDGTFVIKMEHYDSELRFKHTPASENSAAKLAGTWKKRRGSAKWVELPFLATIVAEDAASQVVAKPAKFDGRWKVKFESSDDPAVAIFKRDATSGQLCGTFLTTTGDYRFLAGSADGDQMELSCFDGAHAFLFKAKLQTDGTLLGDFWSSNAWHETWTASPDAAAKLADGFKLTAATAKTINELAFPNLDGKMTRLNDAEFLAPVRIVHIFGSWCPNCHDAGTYLSQLKQQYGDDVSIVGIAFELTGDFQRDAQQVKKYLARHELEHSVLIGGLSDKEIASEAMTVIDKVRSYPTTIFADVDGNIVAVHQGFSGPATGEAHDDLRSKFKSIVDGILAGKTAEKE